MATIEPASSVTQLLKLTDSTSQTYKAYFLSTDSVVKQTNSGLQSLTSIMVSKYVVQNSALTPDSSNICTWTIELAGQTVTSNNVIVSVYSIDSTTNALNLVSAPIEIVPSQVTSGNYAINIYIASSETIAANTYKAVIIG